MHVLLPKTSSRIKTSLPQKTEIFAIYVDGAATHDPSLCAANIMDDVITGVGAMLFEYSIKYSSLLVPIFMLFAYGKHHPWRVYMVWGLITQIIVYVASISLLDLAGQGSEPVLGSEQSGVATLANKYIVCIIINIAYLLYYIVVVFSTTNTERHTPTVRR